MICRPHLQEDADVDSLDCWSPSLRPGGEIARLAVSPDFQNQGPARQMAIHILEVLKQRGFRSVPILVTRENIKAIRSYAHIGFLTAGDKTAVHKSTGSGGGK